MTFQFIFLPASNILHNAQIKNGTKCSCHSVKRSLSILSHTFIKRKLGNPSKKAVLRQTKALCALSSSNTPVSLMAPGQTWPQVHSAPPPVLQESRVWLSPSPLIKVSGNVRLMTSCTVWWIYLPKALPSPLSTCEGTRDSSPTRSEYLVQKCPRVHRLYMYLACAHISCAQCICQTLRSRVVQEKYSSRVNKPRQSWGQIFWKGVWIRARHVGMHRAQACAVPHMLCNASECFEKLSSPAPEAVAVTNGLAVEWSFASAHLSCLEIHIHQ